MGRGFEFSTHFYIFEFIVLTQLGPVYPAITCTKSQSFQHFLSPLTDVSVASSSLLETGTEGAFTQDTSYSFVFDVAVENRDVAAIASVAGKLQLY